MITKIRAIHPQPNRIKDVDFLPMRVKKRTNRKPHRLLTFRPNQIRKLLPKIIPHLIIKKRQAEIVINYLNITSQGRYREQSEWNKIVYGN